MCVGRGLRRCWDRTTRESRDRAYLDRWGKDLAARPPSRPIDTAHLDRLPGGGEVRADRGDRGWRRRRRWRADHPVSFVSPPPAGGHNWCVGAVEREVPVVAGTGRTCLRRGCGRRKLVPRRGSAFASATPVTGRGHAAPGTSQAGSWQISQSYDPPGILAGIACPSATDAPSRRARVSRARRRSSL